MRRGIDTAQVEYSTSTVSVLHASLHVIQVQNRVATVDCLSPAPFSPTRDWVSFRLLAGCLPSLATESISGSEAEP
jgi:hypothetical protein